MLFFHNRAEGSIEVNKRIMQFQLGKMFQYISTEKDPKTNQRSPYCQNYNITGVPCFYDTRNGQRCVGRTKCLEYLGFVAVQMNKQYRATDHQNVSTGNWQTNNGMDFSTGASSNALQGHVSAADIDGMAILNSGDTDLPEFAQNLSPDDLERLRQKDVSVFTECDMQRGSNNESEVMQRLNNRRQM